jgi:alpha-tubulin suppressor-like RCC1 family protein
VQVEHLENKSVSAVFARDKNTACVINNEVWTFGSGAYGILGHGDSLDQPNQSVPRKVISLRKDVKTVAVGSFHMLVLDVEGSIWSFGRNNAGQLGIGEGMTGSYGEPQPVQIAGETIVEIAAGRQHSLALNIKGQVFSWGNNRDAQLGLGDKNVRKSPTIIEDLKDKNIVGIACGRDSSFALTKEGEVYSWGRDDFGQLAHGRSQRFVSKPRFVASLENEVITSIHMGEFHGVAVTNDGRLFSWGKNQCGQVGNGNRNNVSMPIQIEALETKTIIAAAAGSGHTAAITQDGQLWMFGSGRSGELGRGSETESNAAYRTHPVQVPFGKNVKISSIALGAEHCVAILE